MQPLSIRNVALAAMLIAITACGTSMMNGGAVGSGAAGDALGTNGGSVGSGSVGVDASGAQYLDPGANALLALNGNAANGNTVTGGGNTVIGGGNTTNPNRAACEAAEKQLRADDANLRDSNDFIAAEQSTAFQAVLTAAKAAAAAGCNGDILTASTACQHAITTLTTDVEAFWQSAAFQTLEASAAFQAVEADVAALQADACVGPRAGSGCPGRGGHGGGGNAGNGNNAADGNNAGNANAKGEHGF